MLTPARKESIAVVDYDETLLGSDRILLLGGGKTALLSFLMLMCLPR
jgi:hypothetical protein